MSPDVEKLLVDFVTKANEDLLGEHSTKNLHGKVDALHGAVRTVSEGLAEHVLDCVKHRESERQRAASTNARLVAVEAKGGHSSPPPPPSVVPLPPMRSEADSSHDLRVTADKITVAALEGIRDPRKTPEEEIKKVVDQIEEDKKKERRLAELEAAETKRQADAAQEVVDKKRRKVDNRKLAGQLLVAGFGGGGVLMSLVEYLKGLGHH